MVDRQFASFSEGREGGCPVKARRRRRQRALRPGRGRFWKAASRPGMRLLAASKVASAVHVPFLRLGQRHPSLDEASKARWRDREACTPL